MDWSSVWHKITGFFAGNVWNIVRFFAVLVIGIVLIKILLVFFKRIFSRTKMESVAQNFLLAIIRFLLWLVLVLSLLSVIGVELTGVVTALSAAILAVGMALQSNISNVANGIVIVANKMFKKGDYITVNGQEGSIIEINFLFATLFTPDNKKITIPNSMIVNNPVVNYGANPRRRVNFTFPVAYESDLELVRKTIIEVMRSCGKVYLDPEPFCRLKTFSASSLDFFANCWCDSVDYWDVYYYVTEHTYNEFKRHGIVIPFEQVEVRERKDTPEMPFDPTPLPERVEKERPVEEGGRFAELKKHYEETRTRIERTYEEKKKKHKEKEKKE